MTALIIQKGRTSTGQHKLSTGDDWHRDIDFPNDEAIDWRDDFVETEHPRAQSGPTGGQFVKKGGGGGGGGKSVPEPPGWIGSSGKVQKAAVEKALAEGGNPHEAAKAIIAAAASKTHPHSATYANNMLKLLEQHHGLKPGELGKALPKKAAAEAVKAAPAEKPAEKKAEAVKVPQPTMSSAIQQTIYHQANDPDKSAEEKIKAVEGVEALSTLSAAYKASVLAALGGGAAPEAKTPQAAPAPAEKPVKGPKPHPSSKYQQAVYEHATGPGTNAEKIEKIKQAPQPGPYTKEFANEWIKALGGTVAGPATPAPAPAAAAKPAASAATVQTPHKPRLLRAQDLQKKAREVASAGAPEAKTIAKTLDRDWWTTVDGATRDACTSYKGGSGSINGALREQHDPSPQVQKKIDLIDELFENDDAVLTDNVMLRRGEEIPLSVVEKMKTDLAGGKLVRVGKTGFVSTSMASKAAFSGTNCIYEIVARKGVRALGLWAASTSFVGENEVILRHGQTLDVYEIEKIDDKHFIRCVTTA